MLNDEKKFKKGSINYNLIDFTPSEKNASRMEFKTIGQIIARARLEKRPLVVVEGKDDVPIYEQIAKKVNKSVFVRAIETIPNYSPGCFHVKKFIKDAQSEINKASENEKYIIGIIDRDASFFRNEIEEMKGLFVLKAYSHESHFVTKPNLEYALHNLLSSNFGINDNIIDFIFANYDNSVTEYYYYSLEALKNACDETYEAEIGYAHTYGHINNLNDLREKIDNKKNELDNFALEIGVFIQNPISIIKGKWLLDLFIDKTYESILELSNFCSSNNLIKGQQRCSYCQSNKPDMCSWKPKKHHTDIMYRGYILQFFNEEEVGYIFDKFRALA